MKIESHRNANALRQIHNETVFLTGLVARGLTYDDFVELPTVQRAVAFSIRIIQHNTQNIHDGKLRDDIEFDWLPDSALCVSHRRAPIAREFNAIWAYLATRLPLLHAEVQKIIAALDGAGRQACDPEDGDADPATPEAEARKNWTRTLLNYQKSIHQFFTTAGQLNRFCRDHNISPALPQEPAREDVDGLRERVFATHPAPEAAAVFDLHYNQCMKDLDVRDKFVKKIEATVAANLEMMRAFQVPGLSPMGAFAAYIVYPDAAKLKPAQFITHMGFTPCAKRINYKRVPDGLQRQLLHGAMDEAAKTVFSTPDENCVFFRLGRQQEAEGKVPHSIVFGIAGQLSELLWRCLMRHPVLDAADARDAFAAKLARFADHLGGDFIQTLGFASRDDYVAKTLARLNEPAAPLEAAAIPEEPKESEPETVTYELGEAAPKKRGRPRKTPLRQITKKSTKLSFRRSVKETS